jgi:hypothetical protein
MTVIQNRRMCRAALLVVLLLGAGAVESRAAVILEFVGSAPVGSDFSYIYDVVLQSGTALVTGDPLSVNDNNFFTILDFHGLVVGSALFTPSALFPSASFSFSYPATGVIPPDVVVPPDLVAVLNVVGTYDGRANLLNITPVDISLGQVTVRSANAPSSLLDYASAAESGLTPATTNNTAGQVEGPSASVPEPTMMSLFGVGALCALRRRWSGSTQRS